MSQFIHIGFGNIVNTDKIIAVVSPESAPVRRLVQKAKEAGTAVDASQGRRTKAVLVMCFAGTQDKGCPCDGKQPADLIGAAAGDDCSAGTASGRGTAGFGGGETAG